MEVKSRTTCVLFEPRGSGESEGDELDDLLLNLQAQLELDECRL